MRIFKTKWFNREASSHAIKDDELYQAINDVLQGKVDDLGGGVYKKRLRQNHDRAIVLTRGGTHWFYTFLFAKQDMSNISHHELAGFRELAKHYADLTDDKIAALIHKRELVEVFCDDQK